jgi:anthranilate phosphoribosyltransferase
MSIAAYIKEIGRGKEGARSLTREQAHDLMAQLLDGRVSDLEIGAFALAMRIKGESVAELAGFVDAVHERCLPIPTDAPSVILPSYNGARKLPNLTVLLAMLLSQEGVQVLVHGPAHDPNRVTTAEIFFDLGLPIARDGADIHAAWARREPVFVRTEVLCEPLARLLDVRWVVGLRNSGHTVAKVLPACTGALRVVNYTHPEYATLLADYLGASGADALLMRGTEGEPVADARRTPRIDTYLGGQLRPELGVTAHDGVLTTLPVLPRSQDAATTARYVQSVVSGAVPAPPPIVSQVEAVTRALAAMRATAARERSA